MSENTAFEKKRTVKSQQTERLRRQPFRKVFPSGSAVLVLAACILAALMPCTAQEAPKPDPAGIATGDKTTVVDAGGNSFVVTEPTDKTAPDYAQKKKDFDEFQAQAAKEPLAVKLADATGHIRVATNFAWTLNTGYLVLFMQAGFALLTCGLVRKKNATDLRPISSPPIPPRLSAQAPSASPPAPLTDKISLAPCSDIPN
ncbi:MAG: hypothetical protein ACHP9S_03735, partial [Terriglobales bacterium]